MELTIQENVPLKNFSGMRSGGVARYFIDIEDLDMLREALAWYRKQKSLPLAILGAGSNTLVDDRGFPGLVLRIEHKGITYTPLGENRTCVILGAGEMWDSVVLEIVSRGLWGVENLSLIPGAVGGAVVQNIGAYGVEIASSVLWVEAFDLETMSVKRFSREACMFGYRESIFKTNKNLVVLRVALNLSSLECPHLEYEDVRKYFEEEGIADPSLAQIRAAIVAIRKAKMPGEEVGTLGSFFKNPVVSSAHAKLLLERFPELKTFPVSEEYTKISAAWLIDHIGKFRGVRRGDAGVHDRQALILVNHGSATTNEIRSLADEIKKNIFEQTNIHLEEEVVMM